MILWDESRFDIYFPPKQPGEALLEYGTNLLARLCFLPIIYCVE